jgi:hypothetical protein
MTFGRYAKDEDGKRKKYLPSIAQLPLIDPDGFSYVDGYLSELKMEDEVSPESEKTDQILLDSAEQREYIHMVANAFKEFPINVKCEGAHGPCEKKDIAEYLMLPFDRVSNHPERVKKKGPERINLISVPQSYFCCDYCAKVRKEDKDSKREVPESGVLEMEISFMLPDCLTRKPESLNWLFNKEELHGKLRRIGYQLNEHSIDGVIDPALVEKAYRSEESKKMIVTRYVAQRIVSRLLSIPDKEIPKKNEGYGTEYLGWHWWNVDAGQSRSKHRKVDAAETNEQYGEAGGLYVPKFHIPTKNEKLELMLQQMKKQKSHKPREYPRQVSFSFAPSD